MRFLDAQNRKITHIESGIGIFNILIHAEEYKKLTLSEQLDFIKEKIEEVNIKDTYAILIKIDLQENEEFILDDYEITSLFSNTVVSFSNRFEKQVHKVISPKAAFLDTIPASPISVMTAMMLRIVNKPFQIEINRTYNLEEDEERLRLV